eukprot:gene16019-33690_t
MFLPNLTSLGFGLLIFSMFAWGIWPSTRVLCSADGPNFMLLNILGQFISSMLYSFTLGMVNIPGNSNFTDETFISAILHPGRIKNVLLIPLAGFLLCNADFLVSCACTRIPFSTAYPIYCGWGLVQGSMINFILNGYGVNPALFFTGIVFGVIAICAMATSSRPSQNEKDTTIPSEHSHSINQSHDGENMSPENGLAEITPALEANQDVNKSEMDQDCTQMAAVLPVATPHKWLGFHPWIFVSMLAALM